MSSDLKSESPRHAGDLVDMVAAFEVGAGLLKVEGHFVFYALAHGIEYPGVITDTGVVAGLSAADNLANPEMVALMASLAKTMQK